MKEKDYGSAKWIGESRKLKSQFIAEESNLYNKLNKMVAGNFFVKRYFFEKLKGFDDKNFKWEDWNFGKRLKNMEQNLFFLEIVFTCLVKGKREIRTHLDYFLIGKLIESNVIFFLEIPIIQKPRPS